MKAILIQTLSIILLLLVFQWLLGLPWWMVFPVGLAVGIGVRCKPFYSFAGGFLGVFLLWTAAALLINMSTDSILSSQVGELLGGIGPSMLAIITGILGGLVAGMSTLTGNLFISIIKPVRKKTRK